MCGSLVCHHVYYVFYYCFVCCTYPSYFPFFSFLTELSWKLIKNVYLSRGPNKLMLQCPSLLHQMYMLFINWMYFICDNKLCWTWTWIIIWQTVAFKYIFSKWYSIPMRHKLCRSFHLLICVTFRPVALACRVVLCSSVWAKKHVRVFLFVVHNHHNSKCWDHLLCHCDLAVWRAVSRNNKQEPRRWNAEKPSAALDP